MRATRYTGRTVSEDMERHVTLEYWIDDGWYVGRVKEMAGVFSQGATLAELEDNIADAYGAIASDSFDPVPANEIHRKQLVLRS